MFTPPQPDNEARRLAALQECCLLDTPPDAAFDGLAQLAAQICGTPICAVSLIDADRQWFKSIRGLAATQTPRRMAFCAHTILQSDLLIVPDARDDERFADNPLVTGEPHVRFYAGAPLVNPGGLALGSLCVIDTVPRRLTPEQETGLRLLARQASAQIELVRRMAAQDRLIVERAEAQAALVGERQFQAVLLENLSAGIVACDAGGTLTLFNRAAREFHGLPAQPLPPEEWAARFDLFRADGMTPLRTEEIPLFRALRGEVVREAEMVIAPVSGPTFTLLASGQAICGENGEKIGAVVAMHDVTARRQAERETARLAAIVESSEEAILGATLDGTLVFWNNGAERLYGYADSEMIGRHVSVLTPPGQASPVPQVIKRLRRSEKVEPIEVTRRRPDGTQVDVSLSFSPIKDAWGTMIGLSCLARDITARVAAERALRESEETLRTVMEGAPVVLYATDAQGVVTLSEGTGLARLGLAPGQVVGLSVFDMYREMPDITSNFRRALAGEAVSYETVIAGLCYRNDLRPRRAADGQVTGVIGVGYDLSERWRAEEALRRSEARLEQAQAMAHVGSWEIDCRSGAKHWSPEMFRIFGLPPADEPPPMDWSLDIVHPEDRVHLSGCMAEALTNGTPYRTEHRVVWPDGTVRHVLAVCEPVKDAAGGLLALQGTAMDITEQTLAEQQVKDYSVVLEFQKAELERANAELEALATTDGMTGLKNHRAFQERLAEEVSRANRYQTPLSVVLLDIDRFKEYNDAYGHLEGDAVLRTVGRLLQSNARETDMVARYGGEEFVLVLPQTDGVGAGIIAERIRLAIETYPWPRLAVTASLGVATLGIGMSDGVAMVARADQALYRSKAEGRNRVRGECAPTFAQEALGF